MRRLIFPVFVVVIGAVLAGGLALFLRAEQERVTAEAASVNVNLAVRPIADVTRAVRSLKLVTVEIDTKVKVERGDTSWRGDVAASVEVPVRLSFGTDLSGLDVTRLAFSEVEDTYAVRVPRPRRIATEVFGEKEALLVRVGWLRLRSRAGEYYLGLARRDAGSAARELELLPEDAAKVERLTSEQVAGLIRKVVGDRARVVVTFDDAGLDPAAATGGAPTTGGPPS